MTERNACTRKRIPISAESPYSGTINAPARPASAEPNAKVSAYSRAVEMPQARASIGFSRAPRMRRPIEVRARNIQLASMTTIVVQIITVRQIEKSRPSDGDMRRAAAR